MRIVLRLLAGIVAIYALIYGLMGVSSSIPPLERVGWGAFFLLAVGYFGWFSLTGRRLGVRRGR